MYTSNIYALLGLRALFFVLAGIMGLFRYLQVGLCAVLMFIGVKMLISEFVHIPIAISLGVVASVLGGAVIASVLFPAEKAPASGKGGAGLCQGQPFDLLPFHGTNPTEAHKRRGRTRHRPAVP